jgi:hypothetical protein
MGIQKSAVPNRLLNHLLKELPEGVVVPSAWLSEQGISPQLVCKYVAGGWLIRWRMAPMRARLRGKFPEGGFLCV